MSFTIAETPGPVDIFALRLRMPTPIGMAYAVMGESFLPIARSGFFQADLTGQEQGTFFRNIPWHPEQLGIHAKTHILVADCGVSVTHMRKLFPSSFHKGGGKNMSESAQPCYRLLRREPLRDEKQWLRDEERAVSLRALIYTSLFNKLLHGSWLFSEGWVRAVSSTSTARMSYVCVIEDKLLVTQQRPPDVPVPIPSVMERKLGI